MAHHWVDFTVLFEARVAWGAEGPPLPPRSFCLGSQVFGPTAGARRLATIARRRPDAEHCQPHASFAKLKELETVAAAHTPFSQQRAPHHNLGESQRLISPLFAAIDTHNPDICKAIE